MNIPSLLTGFFLGVMALWIYLALAAKRRMPPPTMAKRKQPNAQGEKREEPIEPLYMYGVTGEER